MSDWDGSKGSGKFSPWLLVAFVGALALREYRSGFHNIGMIASISVAAGVMFFFLAPEKFSVKPKPKTKVEEPSSKPDEEKAE